MNTGKTVIISFGEGLSGRRPEDAYQIDSRIPLQKRFGRSSGFGNFILDQDYYIEKLFFPGAFLTRPTESIRGVTWKQLEDRVVDSKYGANYQAVAKLVQEHAPQEWILDLQGYVSITGSGQRLRNGVLKIYGFLLGGGELDLSLHLVTQKTSMVLLIGGFTGGTGAAALLTMPAVLAGWGYASCVPLGLLTHVPSIQVGGQVGEHTVRRVHQMLEMVPNLVVFTGVPSMENGKVSRNVWDDLAEMTAQIAELYSNAGRLAEVHGTTSHLWLAGSIYRPDFIERWFVTVQGKSATVDPNDASRVLSQYIASGHIRVSGSGDTPRRMALGNSSALQIQHLVALVPYLAYAQKNGVFITLPAKKKMFGGYDKPETFWVKDSDLIERILSKLGIEDHNDWSRVANSYGGLSGMEQWLLDHAQDKTPEAAQAYWESTWVELARFYRPYLMGDDSRQSFEVMQMTFNNGHRHYFLAQPKISTRQLAVDALGFFGHVNDPFKREREEEARRKDREAAEAEQARLVQEAQMRVSASPNGTATAHEVQS